METKEFKRITKYDEYSVDEFVKSYNEAEEIFNATVADMDSKIEEVDAKIAELSNKNTRKMSPEEKESHKAEKEELRKEKSGYGKEKTQAKNYFAKYEKEKARIHDRLGKDIAKIESQIEAKKSEIKTYEDEIKANEEKLDNMDKKLPEYDELVMANRAIERKITSLRGAITKYEAKIVLKKESQGNLDKNKYLGLKQNIKNEPRRENKKYKTKSERYEEHLKNKALKTGYYTHARTAEEDASFKTLAEEEQKIKDRKNAELAKQLKENLVKEGQPRVIVTEDNTTKKSESVKTEQSAKTATVNRSKANATKTEQPRVIVTESRNATKTEPETTRTVKAEPVKTEPEAVKTVKTESVITEPETTRTVKVESVEPEQIKEKSKDKRELLNKAKGYFGELGKNIRGKIGAFREKLKRDKETPEETVVPEKSEKEILEEEIKKSAARMKEYRDNGFYDQQASEHEYYNSLVSKYNDIQNRAAMVKLEEDIKKSAARMKEYRDNGNYDQQALEHQYYNELVSKYNGLKSKVKEEPVSEEKDFYVFEEEGFGEEEFEKIEQELRQEKGTMKDRVKKFFARFRGEKTEPVRDEKSEIEKLEEELKKSASRLKEYEGFENGEGYANERKQYNEIASRIYALKNNVQSQTNSNPEPKGTMFNKVKGFFGRIGKAIEREIDILEARLGITKALPESTTKESESRTEFVPKAIVDEGKAIKAANEKSNDQRNKEEATK